MIFGCAHDWWLVFSDGVNNEQTLKRHISDVHEKKKPFACDLCEWSFAQNGQLKTHKRDL